MQETANELKGLPGISNATEPESSVALDFTRDTEQGITSFHFSRLQCKCLPPTQSPPLCIFTAEKQALFAHYSIRPVLHIQEDSHLCSAYLSLLLKSELTLNSFHLNAYIAGTQS